MTLQIEIDTFDRHLIEDLLGERDTYASGDHVDIPGLENASVTYDGFVGRKAVGFPETILLSVVLPTASSIAANVIASWLTSKLQGRANEVRINRRNVELKDGEIVRIIEEVEERQR